MAIIGNESRHQGKRKVIQKATLRDTDAVSLAHLTSPPLGMTLSDDEKAQLWRRIAEKLKLQRMGNVSSLFLCK